MKKSALAIFTLFSLYASAQAATAPTANYLSGNITRTYNAEDLKTRSALLDVSIGDIWVLNLPDDVTDVLTSKAGIFQFKQSGSKVIVGALVTSGTYPVLVTTADDVYFFTIRLTGQKGGGVRNVNVTAATAAESTEESTSVAAPTVPTPSSAALLAQDRRAAVPAAQTRPIPASQPATVRPAAANSASAPTPIPAAAPSTISATPATQPVASPVAPVAANAPTVAQTPPATLAAPIAPRIPAYRIEYRAMSNGIQTALYYHIFNTSTQPVMFDERALTLLGSNGKLPFVPSSSPVNVAPGKDMYGQITVLSTLKAIQAYWSPLGDAALDTKTINVENLIP